VADRPDEYTLTKLASLARQHTEKGIETLGGLAVSHPDPNIKLRALEMLFNRGWGTVTQEVKHTGTGESGAHEVIVRHIQEGVKAPQK
jgi:hypothetical protein